MLKAISDTLRLHGRGINLSALQISDAPFATPAVLALAYAYQQATEWRNSARARLQSLGYRNVEVRAGDGYKGWPEAAPFDRIMLTSAPPQVPQALIDQLKPGGKLVAPVGDSLENQNLVVLEKDAVGRTKQRSVIPVHFVPMVPGK